LVYGERGLHQSPRAIMTGVIAGKLAGRVLSKCPVCA
jgi:hypothetical protein